MMQLAAQDRLLIRMPSWLGDFIMAEPVVRAMVEWRGLARERAPMTLVAPAPFLELLAGRFEDVTLMATGEGDRQQTWRGHDVALFLDGSTRSVLRALRAGIPRRVGWARGAKGLLLTDGVRPALERGATPPGLGRHGRWPRRLPRPFSSACHELVTAMGIPVFDIRPRLRVADGARAAVLERLSASGLNPGDPFVLVNAGGRSDSAKACDPLQWARVLDQLDSSAPVFVVGGPGEEARVRATVEAADRGRVVAVLDPVADLPELVGWCAQAEVVLTADGGVRHVAAAVGAHQVVLFGPTDPRHSADVWDREQHLRIEVPCGPCHAERCPIVGELNHACMTGIRAEAVAAAARRE